MSEDMFKGFRATICHFPNKTESPDTHVEVIADGLLVTRNGKIQQIGDYKTLITRYPELNVEDHRGCLLLPGLIDSHLHYPQTEMIASYGEQLLEWLQNYTFPVEQKFEQVEYAQVISHQFMQQLFQNGTTTALVYSTVHKQATDVLFETAAQYNMCLVAGKVCMDRNCPPQLRDTPESAQQDSGWLIDKWNNRGRLHYALTPRFAPTSSPQQFAAIAEVAQQYPDVFVQTHLSENQSEIDWVKQLYPQFDHYLDVYHHYGLVRPRAVFGHCLHLHDSEWEMLADLKATAAFCPSSNLFLGSGLFNLEKAKGHGVEVALATDVGAGTSFNLFRTLGEAYKVCQLRHTRLSPFHGLYMMTQGAACALGLDSSVGNLNPNTDADFILVDPCFNHLTKLRHASGPHPMEMEQVKDTLFMLSILGDERAIRATYIAGESVYQNNQELNR